MKKDTVFDAEYLGIQIPNNDLLDRIKKAYKIANNAIYFDDSSDYVLALYEICQCLNSKCENKHGEGYIE